MHAAEFNVKPKEEDVLAVRAKLKAKGVRGRFVLMNVGAGWATKRWPPKSFARVADALADEGLPTVLLGGGSKADREAADAMAAECREGPFDMLGETSVRELVALVRLASAHLGGDTGSTHLAAAMDIPAIGLYSITRPPRSCPYGQIQRCHYDPAGLANIGHEAVLETVREAVRT